MLRQMQPYTPSLYEPGGYGRYRQYPRNVETPIPGAGYRVGKMEWAEQELNLDGGGPPQHYGDYITVPLRGVGDVSPALLTSRSLITMTSPVFRAGVAPPPPLPDPDLQPDVPADPDLVPPMPILEPLPPQPPEEGFFARRVGPVPLWAAIAVGAAAVGGGAWWYLKE